MSFWCLLLCQPSVTLLEVAKPQGLATLFWMQPFQCSPPRKVLVTGEVEIASEHLKVKYHQKVVSHVKIAFQVDEFYLQKWRSFNPTGSRSRFFHIESQKSKPFKAFQSSQSTKFCVTTQALQLLRQDPIGDLLHFASLCSCLGYMCHLRISFSKKEIVTWWRYKENKNMFLRPTKTSLHTDLSKQRPQAATGTQSSPHQSPWKTIWLRQRSVHEAPAWHWTLEQGTVSNCFHGQPQLACKKMY